MTGGRCPSLTPVTCQSFTLLKTHLLRECFRTSLPV
uniref:Uncharacterized protein n=1 Tax=Anguilla anguilla TaxID=7936 RepID=A0A0E9XXR4_ANGAN